MADNIITTNITAHADFTSLRAQLAAVTAQLVRLQETTAGTNAKLANQIAVMNKSFATTLTSTGQFSQHFVSLSSDVDKFGKNLDRGRLKLNDYYNAWNGHTKKTSTLIRDLAKQQVMLQQAVVQPIGKNAQGLMQYNVMVAKGLDEVKNKMAIARQEAAIMNKVMLDGSTGLINWGKNTQWAGRQLTVGLTVPLVMFGAAAQKAFREADAELVRLTKVYGGLAATSSADLAQVRKDVTATAKEIASSYGVAYKETIALAADLAATGQQGNELIAATQQTTRLAVLGEVDRQDAMKATLAIQNAFKQSTDELAQSIDFLNAVENQTSTSLADLTEAIPKAGPVIKSLGGDVKDLALYLTAMKEGGVNASEGANAIKSAMASLINPTKVATEQFAGFGIDLKGIVNNNAGNLTATIVELQGALDKLNPLDKSRAIEQLFGKFQFARMSALFENLGKSGSQTLQVMDLMKASAVDLASISERELKMMTESASGQFKRAWAAVQADLASVGEQFLRISTKVLKVVDAIIKFFQNLPGPVKTFLNALGGLTAIAGPLIMMAGVMGNFIGYVVKGIFHLRQLAKGGQGFKLLTPEIIAADAAAKGLATSFYSDSEATIVLSNAVNTLAESFINLEAKANAAKVSVQPAVSTVAGGVIMSGTAAGGRVVDKDNPLVGRPYSRDMSHLIPSGIPQMGTIFGTVPGAKPVNIRVGRNPQAYMDGDLPKIPGLTSIGGTSTGIVAGEAAKWHAMTAAIAMQSQEELAILKKEVMATGTVTSSLSDSYQALLPEFSEITQLAAAETAAIVQQVQQNKITVEAARAKIISLNATVEAMLAETTRLTAAGMGRTANLSIVPLTSQPVVDPVTGKSNMKEMFHKGSVKEMADRIARALGGVRTSGAGYNIATTKPKFAKGGFVPGTGNTDTYHTTAEPGSFVINKASTQENLPMITNILGSKSYYAQQGGQVPVVLTPGEAVIPANIAQNNMPLMYELNGGPGNTSGLGRNGGGGLGNGKKLALQRTHITEDLSGMALLLPRELNLGVNSNGNGLSGGYIANLIRATIDSGTDPSSLLNEAAVTLGGDSAQAQRRNAEALKQLLAKLESPENVSRIIGGKGDPFGFEKLAKDIFRPALRGIKIDPTKSGGRRNLFSAISQIFTARAKEVLTRDEAISRGLISGKTTGSIQKGQIVKRKDGRLTWVSENRTIGSRLPSWAKGTNLATLLTTSSGVSHALKIIAKRNAGGEIGENIGLNAGGQVPMAQRLFPGGPVFLGMPRTIKQVEAQRAAKEAMVKADLAVKNSRYSKDPVTSYDEKLKTDKEGHSFPVGGIAGVYSRDGEKFFVKPVLDEKRALGESRFNAITNKIGLKAPDQRVVVIKDPTDPSGRRKILALESKYDPAFGDMPDTFDENTYFKQLAASALRGDKDLARGNLGGDRVADGGASGVFDTASGVRDYSRSMNSFKHQAMMNLLGIKGSGAKRFFAEATTNIPKGMTAEQYHQRMLDEIESMLPSLKQTISRFDLNPEEKIIYNAMIKRMEDARRENYRDLHGIHSSLQIAPEKTMTPAALAKMAAADELKRRQKGQAASLADNDFKTPQNGFILGGLIGAITKGKALHRIGAGFGKDSTGGWGVTSLEIGMAEKLFASTGLTKRTQRILYDKLAGELAKEMPYGYTKNAQGHLIKALEPDIMDTVIRSAASSTLSDPLGRKVLSQIDREILRKKFANWESRKDTSITDSLKQLIFKLEGREKGGPVNAGQPYIVGEKGPELFVPRNAGGIVPNGYGIGGQIAMGTGAMAAANFLASKVANETVAMIIQQLGFMLPMMLSPMMGGGSSKGMIGRGLTKVGLGSMTTPLALSNKNPGEITKFGNALVKAESSGTKFGKMVGKIGFGLTRFNIGAAVVVGTLMFLKNRWDANTESMRLNALGYGMTEEAAKKAGLKFRDFNKSLKESVETAKATREQNQLLYQSMTGSGTPLNITIAEFKKLKKTVKEQFADQIKLIDKTSADDQLGLAERLKTQFIGMGMTSEEATKKIYAMYTLSKNFAGSASLYTVAADGFNEIKTAVEAAAAAIKIYNQAVHEGRDGTEQAEALTTANAALLNAIEKDQEAALKKAQGDKKAPKFISTADKKDLMLKTELATLEQISKEQRYQKTISQATLDELEKTNPTLFEIATLHDTNISLLQKQRLIARGFNLDMRELSATQVDQVYKFNLGVTQAIENVGRVTFLKANYEKIDKLRQQQDRYTKAMKGQSAAQQISDRDKLSALQKQIDANNKLADARIKALDAAKKEGDIAREIAKAQARYEAALATGNTADAQQASLDMQGLQSDLQYEAQVKAIENATTLKNAPLLKQIELIQKKQQDVADAAALAADKFGDLTEQIDKEETAVNTLIRAMANYRTAIDLHKDDLAKWKTTDEAKGMIAAITSAAQTAMVNLKSYPVDPQTGKPGTAAAEGLMAALETSLIKNGLVVNGDIIINGKNLDASLTASSKTADLSKVAGKTTGNGITEPFKYFNEAGKLVSHDEFKTMPYGAPGVEYVVPLAALQSTAFATVTAAMKAFSAATGGKTTYTADGLVYNANGTVTKDRKGVGRWYAYLPEGNGRVKSYEIGGKVTGPGTGTSDNIPAYLSNGEYVIKEKAVKRYGVATFDALNAEKLHTGGPVGHKHLSPGHMASNYKAPYSGPSMSALSPAKAAANSKATDKFYEKNGNYSKNENGEWVKNPPSLWETFTTGKNWKAAIGGNNPGGPIHTEMQNILLTALVGPGGAQRYQDGRDWAKGEYLTAAINVALARVGGAHGNALMRSFVEMLGASKGIPGLGTLLPQGSIPYMGATTSKFVQNAIPAIMVGTARPFIDNLSPVMSSSTLRPPSISQQVARPGASDQMTHTLSQSITASERSRMAIQNQINLATAIAREEGRFAPKLIGTGSVATKADPKYLFQELLDGNTDDILTWPWRPAIKTNAADPYANQSPNWWDSLYTPKQIEKLTNKQKKVIAMLAGVKVPMGKPFPKITQTQMDEGYHAFYKNEELVKKWGDWRTYRDAKLKEVGLGEPAREKSRFVEYSEAAALKSSLEDVRLKNADGTDSFAFKYTIGGAEADPRWSTAFGSKTSVITGGAGDRGALMLDGDLGAAMRRQYAMVYEDLIKTGFIRRARIDKNGKRIEDKDLAPLPREQRYYRAAMTLDEFLLHVSNQLPGVATSARLQTGTANELASSPSTFVQALNESYVKTVLGGGTEDTFRFSKYDIFGSPLVDKFGNPKAGGYYSLDEGFDYATNPGSSSYRSAIDPSTNWKNQKLTKGKFTIDLKPREFPSPVFAGGGFTDEMAIIVPEWLALAKSKHVAKMDPSHFTKPMSADYGRYLHASRFFKPTEGWTVDDATAAAGGIFGIQKDQFGILADLLNTGKVKTSVVNDGRFGAEKAAKEVTPWTEDDLWKIVTGYNKNAIIKEGNTRRINPDWLQSMSGSSYSSLEQMLKVEELINLMRIHIQDLPPISMVEPKVAGKPTVPMSVGRPKLAEGGYVNPSYSPNVNIPRFETGINNVPVNMLAMLHKNEAVIPANMNPFNPNANNATMSGATYNITNNINGFDGDINQLSNIVTQKTITAIGSLTARTAAMSGPTMTVGIK